MPLREWRRPGSSSWSGCPSYTGGLHLAGCPGQHCLQVYISPILPPLANCRYIPLGVLERVPQRINERPPYFVGRDDLETLMASGSCSDWIRLRWVGHLDQTNHMFLPSQQHTPPLLPPLIPAAHTTPPPPHPAPLLSSLDPSSTHHPSSLP